MTKSNVRITAPKLRAMKGTCEKITVLTAYDYPSARLVDEAGVDVILVGDSLGNVVQGKETTLPVTLEEMIYHAEMVVRGSERALCVVDLPFPFCQSGPGPALDAAVKIVKQSGAGAVKIEGGVERSETIKTVCAAGIPVMGHCGLQPQEVRKLGGFTVQRDLEQLIRDVRAIEEAGAFAVVIECVPEDYAKEATAAIEIPSIGIGAGKECDGQVLVFHDFLGFNDGSNPPKHVRKFVDLRQIILEATREYCSEVKNGTFPRKENSF